MTNLTGSNLGSGARDGGRMAESQDVTSQRVNLPKGWMLTKLGLIIELKYGKSLPAKKRDGEKYPVFGSNGVVGQHSEPLIKRNGIIVGRKGSYGEVQLSEVPFFPIDTTYFVDEFYNQPIKYWYYQLRDLPLTQLNRSTAIPGLNRDDAYSQKIKLPPLAEQKVIADKLDTLLAQVETTKARLERIPQILKTFRQSMLAAAVSGKLTEAEISLIGKVNDCGSVVSGLAFKKSQYSKSGSRLLQIANVGYGYTKWDSPNYIPIELSESCSEYSMDVGDIVLALNRPITNDTLKVARIKKKDLPATLYQRVARIRCDQSILDPSYMFLIMQSPEFLQLVELNLKGSDQPYLNTTNLAAFDIYAPTPKNQIQIVRRVEELFAFADSIEQKANAALARVNNLTQSILAKAFRGELTTDWRAANPELISGDNSAAALLEAIHKERKAEREAMKPKKKTAATKKA